MKRAEYKKVKSASGAQRREGVVIVDAVPSHSNGLAIESNYSDRYDRLLTIPEFCTRYKRSRSRVYELIRSGAIQAVKDGRSTLIPVDAAEAWVRQLPRTSALTQDPTISNQLTANTTCLNP